MHLKVDMPLFASSKQENSGYQEFEFDSIFVCLDFFFFKLLWLYVDVYGPECWAPFVGEISLSCSRSETHWVLYFKCSSDSSGLLLTSCYNLNLPISINLHTAVYLLCRSRFVCLIHSASGWWLLWLCTSSSQHPFSLVFPSNLLLPSYRLVSSF